MKTILLCSSSPLLVRSLYAMLRDEGHAVEVVEHPSRAVRRVLDRAYDVVLIDAEPFGLSAEEAEQIIRSLAPATPVLRIGGGGRDDLLPPAGLAADLEAIKELVQVIAA